MADLPNSANIRQFLFDFFSDEELSTLCFDFFPQVHDNFAAGMTKQQKIIMLLEYCQHQEIVPNLTAALQRARPGPYEKRFPQAPQVETRPEQEKPVRDPKQVFISHAHEDADFAHRLANDLQRRGWRIWIAPDSLRPGEKWVDAINRGLDESSIFVLVLTPEAIKSRWVKDEANAAIQLKQQGVLRFIPLYVKSCSVPPLWAIYQHVSFANDYRNGLAELLAELGHVDQPPQAIKDRIAPPGQHLPSAPVTSKSDSGMLLSASATADSPFSILRITTRIGAPLLVAGVSAIILLDNLGVLRLPPYSGVVLLLLLLTSMIATGASIFSDRPIWQRIVLGSVFALASLGIAFYLAGPGLWPIAVFILGMTIFMVRLVKH